LTVDTQCLTLRAGMGRVVVYMSSEFLLVSDIISNVHGMCLTLRWRSPQRTCLALGCWRSQRLSV